jgi:predicted metal-dependent peptidase
LQAHNQCFISTEKKIKIGGSKNPLSHGGSNMSNKSFKDRWEWIITYMVITDRFVHNVLMIMDKIEDDEDDNVYMMAIMVEPLRVVLKYNKKNLESLKDSEICFILTHEIYHVVLHHCTKRKKSNYIDNEISNWAEDMAINCIIPIDPTYRTMPIDKNGEFIGLLPSKYKYPDKLSSNQYFQMLKEDIEKEKKRREKKKSGLSIEGTGEGNENQEDNSDNQTAIFKLLDDILNKKKKPLDDHGGWKEVDIVDEMIRNKVFQIMAKGSVWENLPGDLQAIIAAAQETKVSWERYLKYHIGNIIAPTYSKTITKPDKRFGYPYLGKKRGYSDKKMVAIDTSSSISDENLSKFLAEINRLVEIMEIDLVLFDTNITVGPLLYHSKHVTFDFKGRGGTDFAPVFKLAEEKHYQSVIILTDGYAPVIEYPHGVQDVLWVLTNKNSSPPVDWGIRVHIGE